MKKTMKKLASIALAGAFALSAVVAAPVAANAASETDASATDGAAVSASGIVDKSLSPIDLDAGEYEAFIYLQGPKFTFRDSWDTDGSGGRSGSPLFDQMTFQGKTADGTSVPATFNDTVIKGNGTYTVSATGIEWPADEFDGQDYMNLIGVSFNMPVCDQITISDVVLNIGGNEVSQSAKVLKEEDMKKGTECYNLLIQNIWNEDENIKNIGYYNVPFSDISVTFTVSGFNYDNPDATGETPAADDTEVTEGSESDATTAASTEASTSDKKDDKDDESSFPVVPVVIGVVVVIAAVIVVVVKKKK